ncbi:MAG: exodeoxyribonuclease VII large subunit [Magnetococcales bacterium]|nr:exodeoxyribonuclease VII large subunit [Magnetococcales bacterium]
MTQDLPWNAVLSVAELNEGIRRMLEDGFPYVRVRGEVSNLKLPPSGHVYFTLGDGEAQIRAVIWRAAAHRMTARPKDGVKVLATGRIGVYPPRGEYQLVVEGLQVEGIGGERERLLQLHRRLAAEGLFDEEEKRPLPFLPEAVGIVTSRSGAALQDVIRVLTTRFPGFHLILAHATVQGENAPREIVAALERLNLDDRAEVIICGRGGGAAEDLAAFNEERVVRAIAGSSVPVISAVGHEVDLTLADLAADWRAPTPSAAAERAMPEREGLREELRDHRRRLREAMGREVERRRERLKGMIQRLRHPRSRMEQARLRCDEWTERLQVAFHLTLARRGERLHRLDQRLTAWPLGEYLPYRRLLLTAQAQRLTQSMARDGMQRREHLATLVGRLTALSPQAILDRGFAIARDGEGRIVRDAAQLAPGESLSVTLARGGVEVRVERIP